MFQRDPLFRGALRLNLLTEQIDIVKPLGWERTSTTLTDMDMNYLLLYLEENYGLTSEKKVQSAIKIVANENRYHPVRDYLTTCNGTAQSASVTPCITFWEPIRTNTPMKP